jgi:hypothetical protein
MSPLPDGGDRHPAADVVTDRALQDVDDNGEAEQAKWSQERKRDDREVEELPGQHLHSGERPFRPTFEAR